jgi:hypothetical protein
LRALAIYTVAGVHTLQFTSYSYYGERVIRKSAVANHKEENTNKLQRFLLYNSHSFSKREIRKRQPLCWYLQWKRRGGFFTEKRHKKVNTEQNKTQKGAVSS